jgi:hypothetical protein
MSRKAKSTRNLGAQVDEIEDNFEALGRNDTSQQFEVPRSAMVDDTVRVVSDDEFNRLYDLTPLDTSKRDKRPNAAETTDNRAPTTPSYSIDPWEISSAGDSEMEENETFSPIWVYRQGKVKFHHSDNKHI